jgi:GTP-binding protein
MFVDEATIFVRGGRGGDGCVSFRREKYIPKGGPDGGDGGRGGSVFIVAEAGINTLLDLAGHHHWNAENGRPGSGANRTGKSGSDLVIRVPAGTIIHDVDAQIVLRDLVTAGEKACVARGGRGGRGNARFASPTNQTPRESTPGTPGQERTLRLELKLIADVGLVGLPNAGKSTLLSRMSRARPKIAAYPFTTLEPHLGIHELAGFRRLVVADLPGLIEGAHGGAGLGDAFLKHIERTRVIVHVVDICPPEGAPPPIEAYRTIRNELENYSSELARRREIIVANKLDLTDSGEALAAFAGQVEADVVAISGVTGKGLRELGEVMWETVQTSLQEAPDVRRFAPSDASVDPDLDQALAFDFDFADDSAD